MKFSCSFDFELGWGTVESRNWVSRSKIGVYERLRVILPRFIEHLDSLEIPITFACVGSMLQPQEKRDFSYLPDVYQIALRSFLDEAPSSAIDARDLFDSILSASVSHEIASHTYSHIHANHPDVNENILRIDIINSLDVFKEEFGLNVSALIFPRDQLYPVSSYENSNIVVIRKPPDLKSFGRYSRYFAIPKSEVSWESDNVYSISGSYFMNWGVTKIAVLKKLLTQYKSQKILNYLIDSNSTFHVWLHPFNLTHTPKLYEYLCVFFQELAVLRDQEKCEIMTMTAHALELV